jgi:hypothetical protein
VKKQLRKKVPAARGNRLAIGDYVELAEFSRGAHRIDPEALSNEGRETRDLSLGAFSCGAVNDFDLCIGHGSPQFASHNGVVNSLHRDSSTNELVGFASGFEP